MIDGIQSNTGMSTEMPAQMRTDMFTRLDDDGDGQIDISQVQSQADAMGVNNAPFADLIDRLTAADTDGDGMVSETEFEAMKPPGKPPKPPELSEMMGNISDYAGEQYANTGETAESTELAGMLLDMLG